MKQLILFFLSSYCIIGLNSQERATLLFFGDIMGHDAQIQSASRNQGEYYDYSECFKWIEPYFRSVDLAIGNLELTFAGSPYTGYPSFGSPDELATALKEAGVDMLVTANNHSCDRRKKGVDRTIDILDENYFLRTGTFKDQDDYVANRVKVIQLNNISVALLNYTYGTNDIPVTPPNIVNLIDREQMEKDIEFAKSYNPDKLIIFIHWGDEYITTPNSAQTDLANFLHEKGVDIIIGSHPHVVQPFYLKEIEEGKQQLTVYSLGNFVSNQRKPYTDGGAMVRVELTKENSEVKITNAEYLLTWVHTPVVEGRKQYLILPASIYSLQGVPETLPIGYSGMYDYLKLAREVLSKNSGVTEAVELWPLR